MHYGALKRIHAGFKKRPRDEVLLAGAALISHYISLSRPPSRDRGVTPIADFQSGRQRYRTYLPASTIPVEIFFISSRMLSIRLELLMYSTQRSACSFDKERVTVFPFSFLVQM
jgi:hypothetical protein